jgi:PBP1b-binding outer membrane lipoprotein LpoB
MKKIRTITLACLLLLSSCASSKPAPETKPHPKVEVAEDMLGEKKSKGLMELLVSGLVIYTIFIFTSN